MRCGGEFHRIALSRCFASRRNGNEEFLDPVRSRCEERRQPLKDVHALGVPAAESACVQRKGIKGKSASGEPTFVSGFGTVQVVPIIVRSASVIGTCFVSIVGGVVFTMLSIPDLGYEKCVWAGIGTTKDAPDKFSRKTYCTTYPYTLHVVSIWWLSHRSSD